MSGSAAGSSSQAAATPPSRAHPNRRRANRAETRPSGRALAHQIVRPASSSTVRLRARSSLRWRERRTARRTVRSRAWSRPPGLHAIQPVGRARRRTSRPDTGLPQACPTPRCLLGCPDQRADPGVPPGPLACQGGSGELWPNRPRRTTNPSGGLPRFGAVSPQMCGGFAPNLRDRYDPDFTRPTMWPSGSVKRPISTPSITLSGPIMRLPPSSSALARPASTSGTST
jgi:hypothetical protein